MGAITAKIWKNLAAGAAAMAVALAAACDTDLCEPQPVGAGGDKVYLRLDVPQIEETVVSRAGADDPDNVIYSAQVFVFDADGGLIYKNQLYNGYADKKPYDTSQALGIPVQTGDPYRNCSIYVFANVAIWDAAPVGAYNFDDIRSLDDLKKVYSYRTLQSSFPEVRDHRPMVGMVENVDLTQATSVGSPHRVEMKRGLAKINFQITVSADFSFYFTGWSVGSMPRYTLAVPQQNAEGQPLDFADSGIYSDDKTRFPYGLYFPDRALQSEVNLTTIAVKDPVWISGGSSEPVSFFMYENRRGGRATRPDWSNVQGTLQESADQLQYTDPNNDPRFKTLYAPADASYIVVKGLIKKNQEGQDSESVRSFSYKIALGGNNTDDYNVERNHSYTYNLRINGMTNNDVSVSVDDFDSRAHRGYGIHIAAPNIDRIDAHYDKRYINVTATPGTIDFALYGTRDEAAAAGGSPMEDAGSWVKLSEMDTYNIDIDPDEATKKTLNFSSDRPNRFLCLYTKENAGTRPRTAVLKISHTVKNAADLPSEGNEVGGDMEIVYHDDGTATVNYYYEVKQAGLLPVTMTLPGGGTRTFYVESYEEYKMAVDPTYTQQAEGMPWGWCIDKTGNTVYNYDFDKGSYLSASGSGSLGKASDRENGLPNTLAIIGAESYGEAFPGAVPLAAMPPSAGKPYVEEIYRNYAARYCYNKNKRDAEGNIVEAKWYLPAYEELCALTKDNAFATPSGWTPFASNTGSYWSSTVPEEDTVNEKPVNAEWYKTMNGIYWSDFLDASRNLFALISIFLGNYHRPTEDVHSWGDAIWEMITKNMIASGNPYEYRNVALSVKNGVLLQERKAYTYQNETYYYDLYTPRSGSFDVRAVRSAEGVE